MPYIPVARQAQLANHETLPENVGELTFQLTMTIQEYLLKHGLRYQQVAEISGALHQCQRDFDERVVAPYEALKRAENGDVWRMRFTKFAMPQADHASHGASHSEHFCDPYGCEQHPRITEQWQFP